MIFFSVGLVLDILFLSTISYSLLPQNFDDIFRSYTYLPIAQRHIGSKPKTCITIKTILAFRHAAVKTIGKIKLYFMYLRKKYIYIATHTSYYILYIENKHMYKYQKKKNQILFYSFLARVIYALFNVFGDLFSRHCFAGCLFKMLQF